MGLRNIIDQWQNIKIANVAAKSFGYLSGATWPITYSETTFKVSYVCSTDTASYTVRENTIHIILGNPEYSTFDCVAYNGHGSQQNVYGNVWSVGI